VRPQSANVSMSLGTNANTETVLLGSALSSASEILLRKKKIISLRNDAYQVVEITCQLFSGSGNNVPGCCFDCGPVSRV
jgi:hypothetical protein